MNTAAQISPARFRFHPITVLLCLLLCVVGCRPKPNGSVAGKWQAKGTQEALEFRSDGTCSGTDEHGRAISGTFALLADDQIQIDLTTRTTNSAGQVAVDKASGICKLVLKPDSFTLIDPDGTAKEYRKARQ